jgi:hypothetical protein
MRLDRCVHAKPASRISSDALPANIPAGFRRARGQEADQIRHVAAADQQTAALDRVADERGDPSHRLRLDLGGGRRQHPRADVGVHRRGEKVAENADRRGWRGDVPEKAGVGIEQRVIEQQLCGLFQQGPWIHPQLRERASEVERVAHHRGRFVMRDRTTRQGVEEICDPVHESMSQRSERRGVHRERGLPAGIAIHARRVGC